MNNFKLLMTVVAALIISGCEGDATTNLEDSIVDVTPAEVGAASPSAKFDPSNSVIPFPNNLLFAGTEDLTLNIPVADPTNLKDPQVALNALDGFSTVAPMTAEFSTSIDSASISGTSVKLYEATLYTAVTQPIAGPVVAVSAPLTFGVDYVAALSSVDTSNSTLAIVPLKPLDPSTSYMVVITDDLKTSGGKAFGPSVTYRLIKSLTDPLVFCPDPSATSCTLPGALRSLPEATLASFEGMRQIINTSNSTVAAADAAISSSDIILSWSFTTQSVGNVLNTVKGLVGAPATSISASTVNLGMGAGLSIAGAANIHTGTIDVPYYLTAPSVTNPTANLDIPWQSANPLAGENNLTAANPLPAATETLSIPLMISTPVDTATYPAPWKTVIYQHGITSNRTTMLALADKFASKGFAVVAIDIPLHGVGSSSPFYDLGHERTFDVDFVTQASNGDITAQVPDTIVDSSGRHFMNLPNLLVTRDNLRQAVTDLFAVRAAIPTMNVAGGTNLDNSEVYFLGHSLGAMVGTTFTALDSTVKDAAFAFGGGGLPKILDGSAAFSPSVVAGLAAQGAVKGTADYETFLGAAQTVVDSGDPVNYATTLATKTEGILFFEIVGGSTSPSDLVVPNTVPDANDAGSTVPAPLAGTEPMLKLMELTHINASEIATGTELKRSIKFIAGNHSSLLDPTADSGVTAEIQAMTASFFEDDGGTVEISNASLLKAP